MHAASIHRVADAGPGVVCLHANPGTGAQWQTLSDRLLPDWRVVIPAAYGPTRVPFASTAQAPTLAQEIEALAPVFDAAGERFHLVGHSWGGALALRAALAYPDRVESVAVYEPALFGLAREADPDSPDLEALADLVHGGAQAVARGDHEGAARSFVDFWTNSGAFDAMPPPRRAQILGTIECIASWWRVLSEDPTPLSAFAGLSVPVLVMTGRDTRAAARCVAEALVSAVPGAQVVRFDGLGHMGPLTHPERVLAVIEGFLSTRRSTGQVPKSTRRAAGQAERSELSDPGELSLVARWALDAASADDGRLLRPGVRGAGGGVRAPALLRPSSDPEAREGQVFDWPPV
jgi:pimeloyl-ACP methyl ester carboxylesterase